MSSHRTRIKRIADEMDQQAESINAHDFVITHRALAILAVDTIGEENTMLLFVALKRELGLPGLTGVCGDEPEQGNILARNGISENWGDWELPKTSISGAR